LFIIFQYLAEHVTFTYTTFSLMSLSVCQPLVRKSMLCRDLVDAAKKYHLRPDLRPVLQSHSTRVRTGKLNC